MSFPSQAILTPFCQIPGATARDPVLIVSIFDILGLD